ncbi:hypothetical protein SAMN05660477_00398 [Soonwooa buanensis]|uniref:Uncharacterized protein n=1 Tax=Soonwooa buanensis TaxID=619805 RepID=A0A1T5CW12_9FLAO|nr:hypothetical protein [Soonwooa buanensis]SKB63557.1 hypothetical protein SAMN05660477_00398 [Soonwooa buanensis]
MTLQQCTEIKQVFNTLVKLEQNLTVTDSIKKSPLIVTQGSKVDVIKQIIRVIEFFLEVTGKELEGYQIQILAGDLYEKFKTDSLDDLVLMFKMARQGEFGKVYKFDTFSIMEWADKYLDYKSATREKLITQRRKVKKPETTNGKYFHELPQELQEKFNAIGKSAFVPRKARELLSTEKMHRDLQKEIDKKEKKKKK